MGMAASQARFLGLTARKTNVEYEGQQVNQQRTCLANQSANYYNQLLGMTVPTPPSIADFTKTVYTFQDGNLTNSVSSLIAQADGKFLVSYTSSWVNDFAPVTAGSAIVMKGDTDGTYKIGAVELRELGAELEIDSTYAEYDDNGVPTGVILEKTTGADGSVIYINTDTGEEYELPEGYSVKSNSKHINDPYLSTLSEDQIEQLYAEEDEYLTLLNKKYGSEDEAWYVRYVQNTSTGTWSPMFYKQSQVNDSEDGGKGIYSDNGTSQSNITAYTMGTAQEVEEVKGVEARLEKDTTGRYIKITLNPATPDEVTYSLTTNTLTDQDAYDSAMNQYEYDKNKYDQAIQEVNTKIEIIQAQDKNLELRLKQLDTEQDAISNEMDAVQKVIEKNTESTFKTFG